MFQRDPNFGWDPWLGDSEPRLAALDVAIGSPLLLPAALRRAIGSFAGADTIASSLGVLPPGLDMYASYVDNFGGYSELVAKFGHTRAFLLSITIFGNPAVCADVEPGAMHASDFPSWYDRRARHDNGLPWGYTSASNMGALIDAAGARQFIRFSAHYGHGPHVCGPHSCGFPQAHWTQWSDRGIAGENYDRSIGTYLPRPVPAPAPAPPPTIGDDDMVTAVVNQDGRLEVFVEKAQTGEVFHAYQQDKNGAWAGSEAGVRSVEWYSLGTPGK